MLININSECNAPFFPPLAHKIILKQKLISLSKTSFKIEFSCHTLININPIWAGGGIYAPPLDFSL